MRWTERQRAMLREMGIRLWERAPSGVVEEAEVGAAGVDRAEVDVATADVAVVDVAVIDVAVIDVAVVAPAVATAGATAAARHAPAAPAAPAPPDRPMPAADWLFVGEPLDGGSGGGTEAQLLDNLLRAIGVGRDGATRGRRAAFLALAERPAGGGASPGDADRREHLRRTVEIVRPACIVALGRSAAQSVLATDESLGSLRGRRHEHAGIAVFVTCPLAFLLRHPEEKAKAWADLCLAVAAADAAVAASRPD